jgi:hypothetical protein
MYIIPSLVALFENHRYNQSLFLVMFALKKAIKDKEDIADQVHATEMRHMIANVAHDLKTVSSVKLHIVPLYLTLCILAFDFFSQWY